MKMNLFSKEPKSLRKKFLCLTEPTRIIEYLDDYETSCGFQNYWEEYAKANQDDEHPDLYILEAASNKLHKVEVALLKEYPFLHRLDIYGELDDFISGDLCAIYDDEMNYPDHYNEDDAFDNHCVYDKVAYKAFQTSMDKLNKLMDEFF